MERQPEGNQPLYYVGIGASAGGLEALQELFSHLPIDTGATFIVVQHLSPDFKSMMPELLGRTTSMPIQHVVDGVSVEANTIYLIPPRKNMLMAEGKLLLMDQQFESHLNLPIDSFLRSLAEDQQHKAIGVVLSGTGSDGTRGIKALKEAGGLVVVQEPSSAKFDGMPISAFNTGLADIVSPASQIGEKLAQFIDHSTVNGDDSVLKSTILPNRDTMDSIFELLKNRSSINFSQYKATTVARRIERRMTINQVQTLEEYLWLLMESKNEVKTLSKELLIGVTRFFRDEEAFSELEKNIVPKIVDRAIKKNETIRVWSAGCSTGEEAYSLAILFDEYIQKKEASCSVKIFATDVDEQAIAEAGIGEYRSEIEQDISAERLATYFKKNKSNYQVSKALRKMVIFATHNLIEDPPFSAIDIACCRNTLIYFQNNAQRKVMSSLYFALKKEGFLFLGSSESLGDLTNHYRKVDDRNRLYEKISNVRLPLGTLPPVNSAEGVDVSRAMAPISPLLKPAKTTQSQSNRYLSGVLMRLIDEYAPDSVVLDEQLEPLHVYGDVSSFVRGMSRGRVSHQIKDLVVEDLSVAVSTALSRAQKSQEDVYYADIVISDLNGKKRIIDLTVFFVTDSEINSAPKFYVLQFIEKNEQNIEDFKAPKVSFDAGEQSRQRIRDLEFELIKNQEHLQITIEELETTNEELQSTNEELMSANEELQSTNEELQSVNEELYTVNSEFQVKINELTEMNDDLDSVINATDIGLIFLDDSLTIRKFTVTSERYVNLLPSDLGRPFHHISHTLEYDDFLADVASVSAKRRVVERTVSSRDGDTLIVRIIPYQKSAAHSDRGVLITLTDVSRQMFLEKALESSRDQLRNTILELQEETPLHHATSKPTHVLLVEDDEVDRQMVKRCLDSIETRDFVLHEHGDLASAEKALQTREFDICLLDYKLPDGTARDFVKKCRAHRDMPIVVLSGFSEKGLDSTFLTQEIYDYLNKEDLSPALLLRSIDYALTRSHLQRALDDVGME